jgi:hypothetical protein
MAGMARPTAGVGSASLEALIAQSMRRGQRRVALQRLLMLEARGLPVDPAVRDFCEPVRLSLPLREFERMRAAAQAWARMVSGRDRGGFEG